MIDISNILRLAGDGYDARDIRLFTRVPIPAIKQICKDGGVKLNTVTDRAKPLVTIVKNSQKEAEIRYQAKQAALEATNQHPYDEARRSCAPLAFANFILNDRKMLTQIGGSDYIGGKPATPLVKMQEANRVLKSLGLAQIDGPGWRI